MPRVEMRSAPQCRNEVPQRSGHAPQYLFDRPCSYSSTPSRDWARHSFLVFVEVSFFRVLLIDNLTQQEFWAKQRRPYIHCSLPPYRSTLADQSRSSRYKSFATTSPRYKPASQGEQLRQYSPTLSHQYHLLSEACGVEKDTTSKYTQLRCAYRSLVRQRSLQRKISPHPRVPESGYLQRSQFPTYREGSSIM